MNVTKKDLSAILKKELKLSVDTSDSLVDEFFQAIQTTLRSKKNLKLSGFGTFETVKTKERMGRNPKNSEIVQVPAKKAVRWKMSKVLFNHLNKNFTEKKISDTY